MGRLVLHWVCVFALGVVPLVGCSDTTGDGGNGGTVGTGGSSGMAGSGGMGGIGGAGGMTGLLVVNGSAQAPPPGATSKGTPMAIGAPSTWLVGLYSFHVNTNADCSGDFLTVFSSSGSGPDIKDFVTNPELFTAEVAPGEYPCVAMRISDVLEFQSATSSDNCTPGVTYRVDVYRDGGEPFPFLDLDLIEIPATGSDAAPLDDQIYVFFSTNPSAAVMLGFAPNQVTPLSSSLRVPGRMTFYWDASNAVFDNTTACVLEPEAPALFAAPP